MAGVSGIGVLMFSSYVENVKACAQVVHPHWEHNLRDHMWYTPQLTC